MGPDRKLSFWIVGFLSLTATLACYLISHHHVQKLNSVFSGYSTINSLNHATVKYDDGLKNISYLRQDEGLRDKEYLVALYNLPPWRQEYLTTSVNWCPGVTCQVSSDRSLVDKADAVVVYAVSLSESAKPPVSLNQFLVFYGMEPPVYYQTNTYRRSDWRGRFNWTLTYRLDSDVPAPYGEFQNISNPYPINFTAITLNKTRPVTWFVSKCHPPSRRDLYVKQLQKFIDVDIYGKCGKRAHTRGLLNNTYKFYLAFENSLCVDYVTEKLFKTYKTHVIPIVRGGADYKKQIPSGTYINTDDFTSPEHLARYLHFLDKNMTAYSEMLKTKHRYRLVNDIFKVRMCRLCRKLKSKPKKKTYSDIHDWLTMSGKVCHPPKDI